MHVRIPPNCETWPRTDCVELVRIPDAEPSPTLGSETRPRITTRVRKGVVPSGESLVAGGESCDSRRNGRSVFAGKSAQPIDLCIAELGQ